MEIWGVVAAHIEILGLGMAVGMGYIARVIERRFVNWWGNKMWARQRSTGLEVTRVPELSIQWL
jgi:hypothetical protein